MWREIRSEGLHLLESRDRKSQSQKHERKRDKAGEMWSHADDTFSGTSSSTNNSHVFVL